MYLSLNQISKHQVNRRLRQRVGHLEPHPKIYVCATTATTTTAAATAAATAATAAAAAFRRGSRTWLETPGALQACEDLAVQGGDDDGLGSFETDAGGVALVEDAVETYDELGLCVWRVEGGREGGRGGG